MEIKSNQIEFAWGPVGGGPPRNIAAIELVIAAGPGGKGTVWIDELRFEDTSYRLTPIVEASSALAGCEPRNVFDPSAETSWRSEASDAPQQLQIDFQCEREYGGLVVHWERNLRPLEFDLRLSGNGTDWKPSIRIEQGVGERSYFWDVNYVNSKNKADQTNFGSYNIRRINLGLGPLANCTADPLCVPINIFGGPGTLTPEMINYIQPIINDSSEQELELFSANITGDLFDMPAGPLSFAAGYEYRDLSGSYTPDALTVAGEYNGVPSLPTSGEYDVDEFYAELSVPVYESGDTRLDLSLAGRYSDYDFGSSSKDETTGKFGLRWQFTDQFLVRGTWAEGFRAPSIGELFGSASRFDATLSDPCSIGLDGSPPTGNPSNCAALGVPSGYQQANSQISVTTGGNPDLDPETADSWTTGFVWSPSFAVGAGWSEKLDVEFNYYDFELDGAIQAIDAQTQLDLCVATLDDAYCDGITRATTGGINGFNNRLVNIGSINTDGFDVNVYWTLPVTDWGQFQVAWLNTFVNDYEAIGVNGVVQPQAEGIEVNDSAIPEWTSNFRIAWSYGDWGAAWTVRHIDDLTENCGDAVDFDVLVGVAGRRYGGIHESEVMNRFAALAGSGGMPIRYNVPDRVQRELMMVDQQLAGQLTADDESPLSDRDRERYIVNALREEAIASACSRVRPRRA
ncbi:MAG: TonB-dependent receptor, partial [Gammaproteobacteria bacterium]|nr:TonB-dependent receptor [Gammaproteobacteria bacterium]